MKKIRKILLLMSMVIACFGISMTAMAEDDAFSVNYGENLPENCYSAMWVGDCLDIDTNSYAYRILSGSENVELDVVNDTLTFIKEGTTQIEVSASNDVGDSKTYTFVISPAKEAYAEYQIPKSVKVGYTVGYNTGGAENAYIYHNCLLNKRYGGMTSMDNLYSYGFVSNGWGDPFFVNPSTRTVNGFWAMTFTRPGTAYIEIDDDEPYAITIESPVIATNLPKKVETGTEMQMTTTLENTVLENKKIKDIQNRRVYDTKAAIGYQPKVEIISGAELVERSDGDYSNILSSSENITFNGEGTVTFKVTYEMLPFEQVESGEAVVAFDETYYSPEATFSVEVTSKSESISNIKVTDNTGDDITVDTSGLYLDSIYKKYNLDPSTNDIEILLTTEKVASKDSEKLDKQANKDGYEVKSVYEIVMTLYADGNKVADLTDNFGTIKLNLQVGKEYAGKKAVVYQLHNGDEVVVYNGLTVNSDGTVTVEVNKLSTFAVAVGDANQTVVRTSTDGSVKTGDSSNIILWVVLIVVATGTIFALIKKKGIGAYKR